MKENSSPQKSEQTRLAGKLSEELSIIFPVSSKVTDRFHEKFSNPYDSALYIDQNFSMELIEE